MKQDQDSELAFTIELALLRLKLPSKSSKNETRDQHVQRRKFIALQIVQAIKKSNWKFEQGPIARGHSTEWKRGR